MAIRPPLGDLYEELGVARGATPDEISAAYRTRAKELHPDARPDDGTAAERFTRLGAAYRVLSNPEERARYDAALARPVVTVRRPPAPAPAPARAAAPAHTVTAPKPFRLSVRNARWAAWGGAGLVVLGLVVGGFVFSLAASTTPISRPTGSRRPPPSSRSMVTVGSSSRPPVGGWSAPPSR